MVPFPADTALHQLIFLSALALAAADALFLSPCVLAAPRLPCPPTNPPSPGGLPPSPKRLWRDKSARQVRGSQNLFYFLRILQAAFASDRVMGSVSPFSARVTRTVAPRTSAKVLLR